MFQNSGTVKRPALGDDSDDGVLYEKDAEVSIVTSDVIDMVQQQGAAAAKVEYMGENILVEGLLFDSFKAEDTFEIVSADSADDAVALEIVEARPMEDVLPLLLKQVGDDDAAAKSIASMLSLAPGFTGWKARVATAGRVSAGFAIAKREAE